MTISTTTSRAQYNGNGVTTIFSFPYRFLANDDLEVRLIAASGASTVLTLTTDYTVTGARNDAGGSVTILVAPASGEQLLIRRIMDLTQETAYPSGDPFPAQSHEDALDKLTMIVQQHDEELARTLQLPPESETDASIINVEAVEVVAGIAADVSAVAVIAADVTTVADNIVDVQNAQENAASAAASAAAAALSAASIALPLPISSGGSGQTTAALAFAALKQAATQTETGVVELATDAEAQAGTATGVVMTPANLKAAQVQRQTAVTLTNQTSVVFSSIPPWVKKITVMFSGVSTNGTSLPQIRLGDSGGIETTGYAGAVTTASTTVSSSAMSTGFDMLVSNIATVVMYCHATLVNITGNVWVCTGIVGRSDIAATAFFAGSKTLSATLDKVSITTVNGTDQYDAGTVNILYE